MITVLTSYIGLAVLLLNPAQATTMVMHEVHNRQRRSTEWVCLHHTAQRKLQPVIQLLPVYRHIAL
jgi:heme exporter protein D